VKAATLAELERAYRDLALVDREDKSCGIVDDIEAERRDGVWQLTALLVGSGAWQRRRPRWLTSLLPGRKVVRIDAADVASATSVVRLLRRSADLGLATTEHRLLGWCGALN
jgi:hypothetical protein